MIDASPRGLAAASLALVLCLSQGGRASAAGWEERVFLHDLERGAGSAGVHGAARAPSGPSFTGGPETADCLARFDALHYLLDLDFDLTAHTLDGTAALTAMALTPGLAQLTLQLTDSLDVGAVRVDGAAAAFAHAGDSLVITLPAPAASGDSLLIEVDYSGTPWNEGAGGFGGFWWTFQVAFSMGVGLEADPPSMGRTWFPCFDAPCDKATAELALTVPLGKEAVGNGVLVSVTADSSAGTTTWTWAHDYPVSTYLIAASVSDYVELTDSTYSFIKHHVYPQLVTKALASFSDVDLMMDAFTGRWGPYPFERFGYVTASKGDMEHQTCVTHLAALVNGFHNYDYILAHEMAHQWWGDGVTVADWRDVWLSEGFATWHEAFYFGWRFGEAAYTTYMEGLESQYFGSGETSAIYDPDPMWGFTSYEKGACVLHMLRHVVGDSVFFDALREHWYAHAYGNHVTADLQATLEAAAGEDLDWFFDEWIYAPGALRLDWSWWSSPLAGGGHAVTIAFDQTQAVGPVYRMPLDLRVVTASGDTTVTGLLDADPDWFQFVIAEAPVDVVLDPGSWVLMRASETAAAGVKTLSPVSGDGVLRLGGVSPNPASPSTASSILLAAGQPVPATADIFDGRGRRVRRLLEGTLPAGEQTLVWDGRGDGGLPLPPGLYYIRVSAAGGESASAKILRAP